MQALTYNAETGRVALETRPVPQPAAGEALIRVRRAGICSTDLEICRGYVPGFNGVLGHEFVGTIVSYGPPDPGRPLPEGHTQLPTGTRVVGEINCNDGHFSCADALFQRNHAPGRSVLGIINRDGAMADYLTLPVENLHPVPHVQPPPPAAEASAIAGSPLTDREAVFAEPLAAACRVVEQGLPRRPGQDRVAVIGDGKLGLLVAQVLACHCGEAGGPPVTLVGRHVAKMELVEGDNVERVVSTGDGSAVADQLAGQYDLVVEASGSAGGIRTALALCRPMGTVVLKSTVSAVTGGKPGQQDAEGGAGAGAAAAQPGWAELANDIVVNEKVLLGSRCGPFDAALGLMASRAEVRRLLGRLVAAELPLSRGPEALQLAATKGTLKVQLVMEEQQEQLLVLTQCA